MPLPPGSQKPICSVLTFLRISVAEARVVIEDYRRHYNEERPHGGLGYRTPAQAFHEAQAGDAKVANAAPAA